MSRHLLVSLTQYVYDAFTTKSPPCDVITYDVSTPPILMGVTTHRGHQCAHGRGGTIFVLYETRWKSILRPTWLHELDLQAFRHEILSYWTSGPDHRQPNTRHYEELRINEAARMIARVVDVYRACFPPSAHGGLRLVSLL